MNEILLLAALPIAGYLVGSIPVAWLMCRWTTGQDMRTLGSGNVGVMNTAVSVARWCGLLVFLSEIAKGVLAVVVPRTVASEELSAVAVGLTILAAVAGTRWPLWLGFRGGRGNTTGLSALVLISWQIGALLLGIWVLLRLLTDTSFRATRLTLLLMPLAIWLVTESWWFALVGAALSLIYLGAQQRKTDDHLIIKGRWSSFWSFLVSPPRKG